VWEFEDEAEGEMEIGITDINVIVIAMVMGLWSGITVPTTDGIVYR
jgi:hypothetical protein